MDRHIAIDAHLAGEIDCPQIREVSGKADCMHQVLLIELICAAFQQHEEFRRELFDLELTTGTDLTELETVLVRLYELAVRLLVRIVVNVQKFELGLFIQLRLVYDRYCH